MKAVILRIKYGLPNGTFFVKSKNDCLGWNLVTADLGGSKTYTQTD